jgi:hypothetical protein
MIFGQAPSRGVATPEEIINDVYHRPTGAAEYLGVNIVDAFNNSFPGALAAEVRLPDDDLTGRRDPVKQVEVATGKRKAPINEQDYLDLMEKSQEHVMNHDEWLNSPYYREGLPFDNRMTKARADFKAAEFDKQEYRNRLRDNRENGVGTFALALGGSLLGTAPDPTNYIPVFGAAFKAAALTRGANIMRRAGVGALDAALMTAITEPIIIDSRGQFGDDITLAEGLLDIALGAALGGVVGGVGGWRERLGSYAPDVAQEALVRVGEASDSLANGLPISLAPSRASERLRSSTSLTATPARLSDKDLAVAPQRRTTISQRIVVSDDQGNAISYPTKSQADKYKRQLKQENVRIEILQNEDGTFRIEEDVKMEVRDIFATRKAAKNARNSLVPSEKGTWKVAPVDVNGVLKYGLVSGLDDRRVAWVERNPAKLEEAVTTPVARAEEAPRTSQFQSRLQRIQGLNMHEDVFKPSLTPTHRVNYATEQPRPSPNTPKEEAQAAAGAGKPQGTAEEIAKEFKIDLETGSFDELADVQHLIDADQVGKSQLEDFNEASELVPKAKDYAKAYEMAAFCMSRGA